MQLIYSNFLKYKDAKHGIQKKCGCPEIFNFRFKISTVY